MTVNYSFYIRLWSISYAYFLNQPKDAFSRAAEINRLSDKKDHMTTFVAELYSDNFYTWKRIEDNRIESRSEQNWEINFAFINYWHFSIISVKSLFSCCTRRTCFCLALVLYQAIIFWKSLFLCIVSHCLTFWARIMELFGMDSDQNCSIIF